MSNICFTTNRTALNDEERPSWERYNTFHRETTPEDEVNGTNTSPYQNNVNNQRRK